MTYGTRAENNPSLGKANSSSIDMAYGLWHNFSNFLSK